MQGKISNIWQSFSVYSLDITNDELLFVRQFGGRNYEFSYPKTREKYHSKTRSCLKVYTSSDCNAGHVTNREF